MAGYPRVLGFFAAPYLCSSWDAPTRIRRFVADVETAEALGPPFDLTPDQQVDLMALDHLGPDYALVLDRPPWFVREGVLTINLFRGGTRLFSVAFSLRRDGGELVATIGGIQGRQIDGVLELYRDMTKASAGMRPRDLLLELLRMICRAIGVSRMFAVADGSRHHRSPYFIQSGRDFSLDYDEIWRDRGGVPFDADFFELPVERSDRDVEEIPARKRSMYRKRYQLLDMLEAQLATALPVATARPIHRKD